MSSSSFCRAYEGGATRAYACSILATSPPPTDQPEAVSFLPASQLDTIPAPFKGQFIGTEDRPPIVGFIPHCAGDEGTYEAGGLAEKEQMTGTGDSITLTRFPNNEKRFIVLNGEVTEVYMSLSARHRKVFDSSARQTGVTRCGFKITNGNRTGCGFGFVKNPNPKVKSPYVLVVDLTSGEMWEEVLDFRSISLPSPMSPPDMIKGAPKVRTKIDALLSFDDAIAIAKAAADEAAKEVKGTPPPSPKMAVSSVKTDVIKVKPEKRKSARSKGHTVKKTKTVVGKKKPEVITKKNVKRCREAKSEGGTAKRPSIAHAYNNDSGSSTTYIDTDDVAKFSARSPNFTNGGHYAPRRNLEHQQCQHESEHNTRVHDRDPSHMYTEMSQGPRKMHVDEVPYSDGAIPPRCYEMYRYHNHNINNRHYCYNEYDRRGFDRMGHSGLSYDVHDAQSREDPYRPKLTAPPRQSIFSQSTPMTNAVNQYMLAQANAQMFASAAAADAATAAAASAMQWR